MIKDALYFILPMALGLALVSYFVGALFYMFSKDYKSKKKMGIYFMSLAVVIAAIVAIIVLIVPQ